MFWNRLDTLDFTWIGVCVRVPAWIWVCVFVWWWEEETMQWKEHKIRNLEFQIRILVLSVPRLNCTTPGASFYSLTTVFEIRKWNNNNNFHLSSAKCWFEDMNKGFIHMRTLLLELVLLLLWFIIHSFVHSFKNDGVWWDVTCSVKGGLEGSISRGGRTVGWLQSEGMAQTWWWLEKWKDVDDSLW